MSGDWSSEAGVQSTHGGAAFRCDAAYKFDSGLSKHLKKNVLQDQVLVVHVLLSFVHDIIIYIFIIVSSTLSYLAYEMCKMKTALLSFL